MHSSGASESSRHGQAEENAASSVLALRRHDSAKGRKEPFAAVLKKMPFRPSFRFSKQPSFRKPVPVPSRFVLIVSGVACEKTVSPSTAASATLRPPRHIISVICASPASYALVTP